MPDFPVQALIPIGAIVAALVAGFFSVLSLIVSKEQKISEFRQQWIDSLRQELSDHMAAVVSLSSMRELQRCRPSEVAAHPKARCCLIRTWSKPQHRPLTTYCYTSYVIWKSTATAPASTGCWIGLCRSRGR